MFSERSSHVNPTKKEDGRRNIVREDNYSDVPSFLSSYTFIRGRRNREHELMQIGYLSTNERQKPKNVRDEDTSCPRCSLDLSHQSEVTVILIFSIDQSFGASMEV